MFVEFDNYLKSDFSENYWNDEGIGIAEEKLHGFSSDDWLAIEQKYTRRDSVWLIRCANALGEVHDSKSLKLLVKLSSVNDIEVNIAALDSINSLLSMRVYDEDFSLYLTQKVYEIESLSPVVNMMLDSLKEKLEKA